MQLLLGELDSMTIVFRLRLAGDESFAHVGQGASRAEQTALQAYVFPLEGR